MSTPDAARHPLPWKGALHSKGAACAAPLVGLVRGITRRLGGTLFVKRAWGLCYAGVFDELGVVAVFVFVFSVGEDVAEDSGYEEYAVYY